MYPDMWDVSNAMYSVHHAMYPHVSRAQHYVSRYVECIKPNVSRAQRYISRYVECIKPNVSRAQRYVSRYVECIKPNVSRAQRYVSRYVECIKPNVSHAQRYVSCYVECIKPNVSHAQRYHNTSNRVRQNVSGKKRNRRLQCVEIVHTDTSRSSVSVYGPRESPMGHKLSIYFRGVSCIYD
ncbi:hypothetical protein H5410_013073 [Solanum commersonii]|uniref:Plant disease resistant protein n=1 Tax=Solanum commersonii TaxID=4109 RepID=A0A9J6AUN1_SOLCO|nr:hypothetical protein H5410_013073 [Solanum commersonii]